MTVVGLLVDNSHMSCNTFANEFITTKMIGKDNFAKFWNGLLTKIAQFYSLWTILEYNPGYIY